MSPTKSFLVSPLVTGRGGAGECPSDIFHREICTYQPGKKGARKKGKKWKWGGKEGNFKRKRWKIEKGRGKGMKMNRRPFFGGVYQNGQFLQGKIIFHFGKKSGKLTLAPLKNIPLTPLLSSMFQISQFNLIVFWGLEINFGWFYHPKNNSISQNHVTEFTPGHAGNIDKTANGLVTGFVAIPCVISSQVRGSCKTH